MKQTCKYQEELKNKYFYKNLNIKKGGFNNLGIKAKFHCIFYISELVQSLVNDKEIVQMKIRKVERLLIDDKCKFLDNKIIYARIIQHKICLLSQSTYT